MAKYVELRIILEQEFDAADPDARAGLVAAVETFEAVNSVSVVAFGEE